MDQYRHITKMEDIKNEHIQLMEELNALLDKIEVRKDDYQSLIAYYYSEQRNQDLEDDENHLIPETLRRGVLSEDEIFDLMGDYYNAAIRMMEIGLDIIKHR